MAIDDFTNLMDENVEEIMQKEVVKEEVKIRRISSSRNLIRKKELVL